MDRDKHIQEEVEKTMNAIDLLPTLGANPFLYTRLKSRMESIASKQVVATRFDLILRPITLVLILLVNIVTALYFVGFSSSQTSKTSFADTIKSEYRINQVQTDNYNLE